MEKMLFAESLKPENSEINQGKTNKTEECWKIIISDDEKQVHKITELALSNFMFDGKKLKFINAYNSAQTIEAITRNPDTAIILQDVVMDSDNAGLDVIRYIREQLKNHFVRIVLRTGQPGQAPEHQVIVEYDINDYKEKTELTSQKLFTLIYSSLRSYRDIIGLERNKTSLQNIITSTTEIFSQDNETQYINSTRENLLGLIQQNVEMVRVAGKAVLDSACVLDSIQIEYSPAESVIQEATGKYVSCIGAIPEQVLDNQVLGLVNLCISGRKNVYRPGFCLLFISNRCHTIVLLVSGEFNLTQLDQHLVELYSRHVKVVFDNLSLHKEIEKNQHEIVNMLGSSIETRSKETGNHIKRVAEFSVILATKMGLSPEDICMLRLASPLHDFGKIGIPDSILNKPGKLDNDEWEVMMNHARIGYDMLIKSDSRILQTGAIISHEHHEKWDGSGYPRQLKGEAINIYGRITAVADVFDALASKRCYKNAWEMDEILDYFKEQRGYHFDPSLVDILFSEIEQFRLILDRYKD